MRRRGWLMAVAGLTVLALLSGVLAFGEVSTARGSASISSRSVDHVAMTDQGSPRINPEHERNQGPAAHTAEPSAAPDETEQARRAALREQILAAQRARAAEATKHGTPPNRDGAPKQDAESEREGLTNHLEGYDQLVDELNQGFLPLSDECITDALARAPESTGEVALEFQLVVDEDLGAVIETVEIAKRSQVQDPLLHECLRESLLSMLLSPGAADGSAALVISLLVEPEA